MTHWHVSRRSSAAPFPFTGERRRGGFLKRCVSMLTKGRGTRRATPTIVVECSSHGQRGGRTVERATLPTQHRASSFTAPSSSGHTTADRGESGPPLHAPVIFRERLHWLRWRLRYARWRLNGHGPL